MANQKKKIKEATIKEPKKRATNYDEKLTIDGSFEDLVKELVTPKPQPKKK